MKSLILSLGTMLLFVLTAELSFAQTTASNQSADCAKVCADKPNCTPADCAKLCNDNPNCKPEDCAKLCNNATAACAKTAETKLTGVEAAFAILVNAKKESPKTSCCSKVASTKTASCAPAAKSSKLASNN